MRLTIMPPDGAVYIDGYCKLKLDLSGCGIPGNTHALQWYETRGWIEPGDDGDPFTPLPPNEDIFELPQWALNCVEVFNNYVEPTDQNP